LQSLATQVDVQALADGKMDKFNASIASVRSQLKPISDYAKRFTLFFDANAHIDAAWLWREKETIEVCKNTFSSVLNMMSARPDFTYTQSAAAYYDWMERFYPEIFKGIRQRVQDGRWEVVGGMWVEPDCNLPSGESWARHLLYAKRYFKNKLGVDVKIGWNPDSFGYNWNMPQFYLNAGVDAFITQKIGWNETNVFPHRLFWWEGLDGSRILAYFPFDYVNTIDDPFQLVDWLRQHEANTGIAKMMILFGVGDHGGGPSLEMIDRIERLKTLDIYPQIEYGTAGQYLGWLKSQNLDKIPTWKDELYLEYHQGTYTTQAKMKEYNR
jgi:alpha-mannosidase